MSSCSDSPKTEDAPSLTLIKHNRNVLYISYKIQRLRVSCRPPGIPKQPGNPTTNATEGNFTHLVDFLRLSSMKKVALFGGCSSRGLGGLLSKTAVSETISGSRAVHTCCCSYCCMTGDLARADQAQLWKIYCHKRYINLSRTSVCSVYRVLRKCTPGDRSVYLHRAGPGAMGHRRCLKAYDRASK